MLLEKGRILAQVGAQVAGEVFEKALASGELTREQLFDANYVPIPGSQPPKFSTAFDSFTDAVFRQMQDQWLADQDVVFAAVVDRNGYLPTHNTRFSSGGVDSPANQTKRLFNDPVG